MTSTRVRISNGFLLSIIAALSIGCFSGATFCLSPQCVGAESTSATGMLRLRNGDTYQGDVYRIEQQAVDGNGTLQWNCPSFGLPLEFPWNEIDRLNVVSPSETPSSLIADYCITFHSGDMISGAMTRIDRNTISIQSPLYGTKSIPLASVQSVLRMVNTKSVAGNTSLTQRQWKQYVPAIKHGRGNVWYPQAGSIDTQTAGTSIMQEAIVPELAAIDIQATWDQTSPNWLITIGEPRELELHVRKVQNRKSMSIRLLVEHENHADISRVEIPIEAERSLSLKLLCDAKQRRYLVQHNNQVMLEVRLKGEGMLAGKKAILVTNMAEGRFSLKDLTIAKSIFSLPRSLESTTSSPTLLLDDGQSLVGTLGDFDDRARSIQWNGEHGEMQSVSLDRLDRIEFPQLAEGPQGQDKERYVIETKSGGRFAGESIASLINGVDLMIPPFDGRVSIPIEAIQCVTHIVPGAPPIATSTEKQEATRSLRMVTGSTNSSGNLVAVPNAERTKVVWQPQGAISWSTFKPDVVGAIELIGSSLEKHRVRATPAIELEHDYGRPLHSSDPSLFLVNGDSFPAKIESFDDETLRFHSSIFPAESVSSKVVRGFRLLAYTGTEQIDKETRKRFLTLPRSQRNNPPSHVIVSRERDYVRGKLKSLTGDYAVIEVRGEEKRIALKNVAEVIWLQEAPAIAATTLPSLDDASPADIATPDSNRDPLFQISTVTGTRFSIHPSNVQEGVLKGVHPILGECSVPLDSIMSIALGNDTSEDANRNRFSKWKLMNAPDPKFVNDLDDPAGDAASGEKADNATWIGANAPDFELMDLDGKVRTLQDYRGKVVVLDFFATWCGPCIASMPKMVETTNEYKASNVELIAVNLEQSKEEVRTLLSRLDINPSVVLDTDGAVSRKFGVKAIPQTVIIDAEGVIRYVFVGGGAQIDDRIRKSLDELLHLRL